MDDGLFQNSSSNGRNVSDIKSNLANSEPAELKHKKDQKCDLSDEER